MGLFWPTKLKPEANVTVRVGRVVHWLCTLVSVLALLLLAYGIYYTTATDTWDYEAGNVLIVLLIVIMSFAVGRGLRYIIAAE